MKILPPCVSARKMSLPLGATISQRGSSNSSAKMLTLNPAGTVGIKPFGGEVSSGALVADLVAKGAGNLGFLPSVTWADKIEGRIRSNPNKIALCSRNMESPQKDGVNKRQIGCLKARSGAMGEVGDGRLDGDARPVVSKHSRLQGGSLPARSLPLSIVAEWLHLVSPRVEPRYSVNRPFRLSTGTSA